MTSPEQLPPTYELSATAQRRMRNRVVAEVAGAPNAGRSRRPAWSPPMAVAASVLVAAGGFGVVKAVTGGPGPTSVTGAPAPMSTVPPSTGGAGPSGVGPSGAGSAPPASAVFDGIDCGTFTLQQGEKLPLAAVRCVVDAAAAGTRARLVQTSPTTEGDPVTTTYQVEGREEVRVITDVRADRFSSVDSYTEICAEVAQIDDGLFVGKCMDGPIKFRETPK